MVMRDSTISDPGRLVDRHLISGSANGIPASGRRSGYPGQAYEPLARLDAYDYPEPGTMARLGESRLYEDSVKPISSMSASVAAVSSAIHCVNSSGPK
jgi:hypothetical protein